MVPVWVVQLYELIEDLLAVGCVLGLVEDLVWRRGFRCRPGGNVGAITVITGLISDGGIMT